MLGNQHAVTQSRHPLLRRGEVTSMTAARAVHMVQPHVYDVRQRDQRAADTDHHRMPRIGVIRPGCNADDKQDDPGHKKDEGAIAAMFAQSVNQTDRGEDDGKADKDLLKTMVGEEAESQRRQNPEHQRQERTVHGAKHRRKRTKSIDPTFEAMIRWQFGGGVVHGDPLRGKHWRSNFGLVDSVTDEP